MKSPIGLLLVLLMALAGCDSGRKAPAGADSDAKPAAEGVATTRSSVSETDSVAKTAYAAPKAEFQQVSLTHADTAASAAEAADRKIIRNANLTLEVKSTSDMQHKVTSIAESHGGFVVTSEAKQREHADPSKRTLDIKLVVRIPSERFGPALDEIKQLAGNLPGENISGQDVTEDFIDLEARIKTQKALESQFLAIMKQAGSVTEALEVQRQIADVRTDIEKLEGRKRFLENRSSLSTITVNIQKPKVIAVSPTGFGRTIRDAVSDSLDLASGMFIFFLRTVIVMMPV